MVGELDCREREGGLRWGRVGLLSSLAQLRFHLRRIIVDDESGDAFSQASLHREEEDLESRSQKAE